MNPTTFVIQAVILTLFSLNASSVCPTGRNQFIDCANPRSYIQEYIGLDCPQFKLRDGLEAQWTFIRNRNIGVSIQNNTTHKHQTKLANSRIK